jgi:hypothetical protein
MLTKQNRNTDPFTCKLSLQTGRPIGGQQITSKTNIRIERSNDD